MRPGPVPPAVSCPYANELPAGIVPGIANPRTIQKALPLNDFVNEACSTICLAIPASKVAPFRGQKRGWCEVGKLAQYIVSIKADVPAPAHVKTLLHSSRTCRNTATAPHVELLPEHHCHAI